MEHYLAIKSKEVVIHVSIWMNLKNIILSERARQKDHIFNNPVYMNCPEKANL